MARLEDMLDIEREHLIKVECPSFPNQPWQSGPPLRERRIAVITTAGVHRRGDRPFTGYEAEYRVIPGDIPSHDLVMSHLSTNFDRTGFMQDWNVVFPLERLRTLADRGVIAGPAAFHYSFCGAAHPRDLGEPARELAALLKEDGVNGVLLSPV